MDQMDNMGALMDDPKEYMHNAFWQEEQVAITFHSDYSLFPEEDISSREESSRGNFPTATTIIGALRLQDIDAFLNQNGFSLMSFDVKDVLITSQSSGGQPDDLNSLTGKYLFRAPKGQGTNVICFFHFKLVDSGQPGIPGDYQTDKDADDSERQKQHPKEAIGDVPRLVNLINQNLDKLGTETSQVIGATPNWYSGATSTPDTPRPQGCPLTPPIPVPASMYGEDSPGLWPITVPELSKDPVLSHSMHSMTGDGVTVIVLDTLPKAGNITRAAEAAEDNNLLLLDVANNVTFQHNTLSGNLDIPSPLQPATGKDIDGRLVGFHMPDHGLFIAGIIRDLAPNANVECVRILNDFCVGNMAMLTKALEDIHTRMLAVTPDGQEGNLHSKPVVINMSLTVSPTDEDILAHGFDPAFIQNVRASLLGPIQSLADLGAVFAASTGNEADPRSKVMNPNGVRFGPLYPAAFAYDPDNVGEMIPVGAVNKYGDAASYSNYPGTRGIATYGGEVPTAVKPVPPDCMTEATNIDAMIGIYTELSYPALSARDCESRYSAPNANAWAYWSGTSFATPIISALAARVLELKQRGGLPADTSVRDTLIISVATQQTQWTRLEPGNVSALGALIMAVQQSE